MYSKHLPLRISDEMDTKLSLMAGNRPKGTMVREWLDLILNEFTELAAARNCSEDELKDLFASIQIVPKGSEVHSLNLAVEDAGVK